MDLVPRAGAVTLVVLGDPAKVDDVVALAVRAGGRRGGAGWLVLDVPVDRLPIRGRAAAGASGASGPPASDGSYGGRLVGPDIVEAPVPTERTDAQADPFADAVLVGGAKGYRCSGVALDATHVLTAGHCAPATHVGIGTHADAATRVEVTRSDVHPVADAAVLTLAAPIAVGVHPRRGVRDTTAPTGRVRILGFGVRDPLRFTGFGVRRQVDLNVTGWGCPPRRAAALGCRPGLELHLRDSAGNDTCFGDSGGPVFEATPTGWRLVAITSRGSQPRRVLCGEGGIYTRLDWLAPWLLEVITP
ncbi:MAG: trypsin-like serine protease [Kofleriaceae bacterium]